MRVRATSSSPLYLVGFMAAGKTTVGRTLAEALGWEFADTDALVEAAAGCAIEEIFRRSGEGAFRDAEWNALRSIEGRREIVVATGGGLFLGVVHRAFIRASGLSCWLDVPLETALARITDASSRPLVTFPDVLARRAFFERRRAVYALADMRVDASTTSASDVARAIEDRRSAFLY